jgi:glycosyltransferase involved in cell wall biosynthesis
MYESSLFFSHQREVARRLSERYSTTIVLTADESIGSEIPKIRLITTRWKQGSHLRNVVRFYRIALPLVFKHRTDLVIFSHMTEVQSFLLAPWCRIFRIPHYLWYAHTSKSLFLTFSYPFISGVVTSTPGSCPINGHKVYPIGQAINENGLKDVNSEIESPPLRWYHVGRIDPSKNIDLMISVFTKLRNLGWDLKLDIYGAPSSDKTEKYLSYLYTKYQLEIDADWLHFRGPIKKENLPSIAEKHDGFVHAFQGSLDKALLEAILCKRIVVSINSEYVNEFTAMGHRDGNVQERLLAEMLETLNMPFPELMRIVNSKYETCLCSHTLDRWIIELCKVLDNEK